MNKQNHFIKVANELYFQRLVEIIKVLIRLTKEPATQHSCNDTIIKQRIKCSAKSCNFFITNRDVCY